MGRSIGKPIAEPAVRNRFHHQLSNGDFRVIWQSGQFIHASRSAAYPVKWAIGSGNEGKSYLVRIGDALFQSPISWYTRRAAWDLSPGFESDPDPGFYRPVTADCLFCHTGNPRPIKGTLNRYLDPPFDPAAIGCDRCHGDPAGHLASPAKNTIVNPSRLERQRRDAVCEQCHLSGEARIPNPGKDAADFRPGMLLEDVFTVYVKEAPAGPLGLKVVSHSEQMARSRCSLESGGKLWCGTCHSVHDSRENKVIAYARKCMGCHATEETKEHAKTVGEDCAGCHMPKLQAYDGGHTAFHDHWIRLDRRQPQLKGPVTLKPWRRPPEKFARRNLALALIGAGSKDNSMEQLVQGLKLLDSGPMDGAAETARGFVLLRLGKAGPAVESFRRAVEEEPSNSTRRLNLAAALSAGGQQAEAKQNAEKAIAIEPLLEDAYALLAELEPQRRSYWLGRFRSLINPKANP